MHGSKPGAKSHLSAAEEEELAGHLINVANIGYGKTREVLTTVERHVELKEDISLRAAKVTHGWWQKFKERSPSLSLRSGDSTSAIRLDAVNEENMNYYFNTPKVCDFYCKKLNHMWCRNKVNGVMHTVKRSGLIMNSFSIS